MSGLWDRPGVPHKNWTEHGVETLDEATHKCDMCGTENIRFVHHVSHPEYPDRLEVGHQCASKMSNPYLVDEHERIAKNRISRREKWPRRKWRLSKNGNPYIKDDGWHIVAFPKAGAWAFKCSYFDDPPKFSDRTYATVEAAQVAAFDVCWPPRTF